jgi:hypothetical protein
MLLAKGTNRRQIRTMMVLVHPWGKISKQQTSESVPDQTSTYCKQERESKTPCAISDQDVSIDYSIQFKHPSVVSPEWIPTHPHAPAVSWKYTHEEILYVLFKVNVGNHVDNIL